MRFLASFSVLLLALLLPLSAAGLPPEEMTTSQIVQELNQIFSGQQSELKALEADLMTSQEELKASKEELTLLKADLKVQQERLNESLRTVTDLKSYLPSLVEEQQKTISSQKIWLYVLTAAVVGLGAGVLVNSLI